VPEGASVMIERDRAREWLARGWWLLMPPA